MENQNRSRIKHRRIALVGYRATGKTVVGKELARELNWDFIDMDEVISSKAKLSIEEMVKKHGWNYFRKLESSLLVNIAKKENIVVATGGGIVINTENRATLKNHFITIWLKASPAEIEKRLQKDTEKHTQRPSLTGKDILSEVEEVLRQRLRYYEEVSDFNISTENISVNETIFQIRKLIMERN